MYVPPHFAETDLGKLHDFIERHSFGLLVSQLAGTPFATHLPFLLERASGPHGALIGHMARANPHWTELAGQPVLAVFSGPHAYISPTWYESANVVPTWNYTAVHAYGSVTLLEKGAARDVVARTVSHYESPMPQPWAFDADSVFADRLLDQIVGFRLVIEKIEGKMKLNQNHPAERQEKVARALRASGGADEIAVAELMKAKAEE
ncbi:MAG: FMN-binding negative transcriptional regulator [Planctomycetes bacterium]|nr:FMN-binding negative transcriptional regulator [Planctomycetota bacterium]